MKRLLSLLLVIAMLFGICTIFTACDSASVSDKDDDDDDRKKDDDEDDDVEPTLVLMGLKIVLPEDFELENQNEYEGDQSASAYFVGDDYSVAISCGPLSGEVEGLNAKELRDYTLEQIGPENEESEIGEYDTGSKNKTPYFYAIKNDETQAIGGAFYVDDDYAWQVRIMNNEDSEDFDVEEMIALITGWKYEAPKIGDEDPEDPTQAPQMPTQSTVAPPEPSEPEEPEQIGNFQIPAEGYDGSPVTITFYHNFNANKQNVLEAYIAEFNRLYPTIRIQHQTLGDMDNLHDQISVELKFDDGPNIALCTPDQIAYYQYIATDPIVTLDDLMFSKIPVSRADGTQELLGLSNQQYNDLYTSFLDTTRVFGNGMTYAMPFSKNMEVLYYNKTFFETHGIPVPTTWDELEAVCRIIKEIDPTCTPLGYDSEANLFINYAMQTNGGYIDDDGSPAFNSGSNQSFMQRVRGWYQEGLITTREIYGGFTSHMFVGEYSDTRCYMSVSTSSGAGYYNSPDGSYELGVAMIPQMNSTPSVISGGTDLCIFQKKNPQEVIASWLFVEFLSTNMEFQAEFSMATGYLPVVRSATEHPTYMTYLRTADGYVNTQALSTTACLDFVDWCAVPNATSYGDRLTDAITNLVMRCMTWSMSDEAWEIMEIFNMATTDIY